MRTRRSGRHMPACALASWTVLTRPDSALAVDSGRLALLAREAADVLWPAPGPSVAFLAAVVLGALVASLVGAWLGVRSRRRVRAVERPGELTFRFRSPGPLRVDSGLLARMAGALDGKRESAAPVPEPVAAAPRAESPADPARSPQRIVFRRDARIPREVEWRPPGVPR